MSEQDHVRPQSNSLLPMFLIFLVLASAGYFQWNAESENERNSNSQNSNVQQKKK